MRATQVIGFAVAAVLLSAGFRAHAADGWNEATNGDLSNDSLAPTAVTLGHGINNVEGTTGNGGAGIDRDFFSFSIANGSALTAIVVGPNTFVSGGASFIGIQVGNQVTNGGADLLGFAHYGPETVGTDILPLLLPSSLQSLSSGHYAVWVQETGGTVTYSFDFVLSAVPEPASGALLGLGALALAFRRRVKLVA